MYMCVVQNYYRYVNNNHTLPHMVSTGLKGTCSCLPYLLVEKWIWNYVDSAEDEAVGFHVSIFVSLNSCSIYYF